MTPRAANAGAVSHRSKPVTTPIVPILDSANNLKRCTKCGEFKPREAFNRRAASSDGLQYECKACRLDYNRAWIAANEDHYRQYQELYRAQHAERTRERVRKWRNGNRVRVREYNKRWKKEHPERARETARRGTQAYRDRNRDLVREKDRDYKRKMRLEHPERTSAIRSKCRAKRLTSPGAHTAGDLRAIRTAQTDKQGRLICWACGKPINGTPHLDHWIPLAKGGRNDPGNLHYMHAKCNQTKSAKMPTEIGRLL